MGKKRMIKWLMLVLLIIFCGGCANFQANPTELRIGLAMDIGNLDPLSPDSSHSAVTLSFENLVRKEGKTYIPVLAEGWHVSPDERVWEFTLRSGVLFSDGSVCDAQAVKFSLDRYCRLRKGKGGLADAIEKTEILDQCMIRIVLKKTYAPLLDDLCRHALVVVSPDCVSPKGDIQGKWTRVVGTGPFTFESSQTDQQAMFHRNETYWGEKARIARLALKIIPDEESRALALESGQIDVVYANWDGHGATFSYRRAKILEDKGYKIVTADSSIHKLLVFNTFKIPLQDTAVRSYLYSILKAKQNEIVSGVLVPGEGTEVNSLFSEDSDWFLETANEASDRVIPDQLPSKLRFLVCSSEPHDVVLAQLVQAYLAEKDIKVEIQQTDMAAFWDYLSKKEYDITLIATMGVPYDPWGMLNWGFGKASASIYYNGDLAEQIDLLNQSRRQEWPELQKRIHEQMVVSYAFLPLYREVNFAVMNADIKHLNLYPGQSVLIPWTKIEKSQK